MTVVSTDSYTGDVPDTHVLQVVPARELVSLTSALTDLANRKPTKPFSSERVDFVADLARTLSKRGRGLPETQALAFWMRRAELARMAESLHKLSADDVRLMPRGTVFHVPPANVDTIFVYSLVLSVLAGNRNIVRLSSRATTQSNLILDTINEVLVRHPKVASSTLMLSYGHDDSITSAISSICDTRVIWGGDSTVAAVRKCPLPPHATELTFPDRFSMAGIGIESFQNLSSEDRDTLVENFFNDTYWFDQLGCSSARLLIWVGDEPEDLSAITEDFAARLHSITQKKSYLIDTSAAIAKLSQSMSSIIDEAVTGYHQYDNSLTVLDVADFPQVRGDFCGGGLFYQMHVQRLSEIAPHVTRMDQTLASFGIEISELDHLVESLCGSGIDRIVPIGQALAFDRVWDGFDLLSELVRRVVVRTS